MRRIVTFGDSFTYGEELSDRTSAWPQQVANACGLELLNNGAPGTSNDSMVRKFFEYLASVEYREDDIIAIAWTSPGRIEFSDMDGHFDIWPGVDGMRYKRYQPWRQGLIDYFDQHHSPEWLYQRFLQTVTLAQMTLKGIGLQYVMLDTCSNDYYKNIYRARYQQMSRFVDSDHYIDWNHAGMAEWVGKVPRGPGGHFLEKGHSIVAAKVAAHIKRQGII